MIPKLIMHSKHYLYFEFLNGMLGTSHPFPSKKVLLWTSFVRYNEFKNSKLRATTEKTLNFFCRLIK